MQPTLDRLWKAIKLQTCAVVDIGARFGVDTRWKRLGPHLRVIGFEPDPDEYHRLSQAFPSDPKEVWLPDALGEITEEITIHLCRSPGASSRYLPKTTFLSRFPNIERFDIVQDFGVTAQTLDNALANRPAIDFIKLDTQGTERDIVAGGPRRFQEAFGVEVEAEFSEIYAGQNLFADIDHALRESGFVLFDLRPCYWKRTSKPCRGSGQLLWADALYLRDPIASGVMPLNPPAALAISLLYQKFDFAIELAGFFESQGVYSHDEHGRIALLLNRAAAGRSWGAFPVAGRISKLLRRIADSYYEAHWARYESWRF